MIGDFLSSWSLLGDAYMLAMAQAVLLSLVGILVVARNQIFMGIALAQASMLGVAVGVWAGLPAGVLAVGAAVAGAVAIGRGDAGRAERSRVAPDEATAWLFVGCWAMTTLVLSWHPQARTQVRQIQQARFVGAEFLDVVVIGVVLLVVAVGLWLTRRRLVLLIADPVMAAAIGMPVARWGLALAIIIGLSIGLSIRGSGVVFTFGCLVLPALTAKALCRNIGSIFAVAPVLALVTTLAGLVLAFGWNLPQGQLVVALQAVVLVAVWGLTSLLRRGPAAVVDGPE